MHPEIMRFHTEGECGPETEFVSVRNTVEREIISQMRDDGFVPVLDINPLFTQSYVPEKDKFRFTLSVYGVRVGDKSWQIEGWGQGRFWPRIQKNRSSQS